MVDWSPLVYKMMLFARMRTGGETSLVPRMTHITVFRDLKLFDILDHATSDCG